MPRKSKRSHDDEQIQWREDAASLSYEESLQALDLLLTKLQDDSLPLAELQGSHQRAEIYLSRCEELLKEVEQSVALLNPDTLERESMDCPPRV